MGYRERPGGFSPNVETTSYGGEDHLTDYHPPVDAQPSVNLHPFKVTRYTNEDDELIVRVRIGRLFYTPNTLLISKLQPHGPHGESQALQGPWQSAVTQLMGADHDGDGNTDGADDIHRDAIAAAAPQKIQVDELTGVVKAVGNDDYVDAGNTEPATAGGDEHSHGMKIHKTAFNRAVSTVETDLTGIDRGQENRSVEEIDAAGRNDARDNPLGLWPNPTWTDSEAGGAIGGGTEGEGPEGIWAWESVSGSSSAPFARTGLLSGSGDIPAQFFSEKEGATPPEIKGFGTQKNMHADFKAFDSTQSVWLVYVLKVDRTDGAGPQLFSGPDGMRSSVQVQLVEGTETPTMYGQLGDFEIAFTREAGENVEQDPIDVFSKEVMLRNAVHLDEEEGVSTLEGFENLSDPQNDSYSIGVYYIKIAELTEVDKTAEEDEPPVLLVDQIIHDNIFISPTWVMPTGEIPTGPGFGEEGDPIQLGDPSQPVAPLIEPAVAP